MPIITKSGGENYSYALGINNGDQVWLQFSDANDNNIVYTTYGDGAGQHLDAGHRRSSTASPKRCRSTSTACCRRKQSFNTYAPVDSGSPLVIAADQPLGAFGDGAFQGMIQQVALWNVALSATEIAAELRHRAHGTETGLRCICRSTTPAAAPPCRSGAE